MRLILEGGTNIRMWWTKLVSILHFNILARRGEFHPHTSSFSNKIISSVNCDIFLIMFPDFLVEA